MRFFKLVYLISAMSVAIIMVGITQVYGQVSDTGGNAATRAPSDKPFRFGAKVGTTLSQFNQTGLTIGWTVGGFAKYHIIPLLDVRAELLYIMQGGGRDDYTRDLTNVGGNVLYERYMNRAVSFQSIQIPVMAVFNLGSLEGSVKAKAMVGFSYGYCVAAFQRSDVLFTFNDGSQSLIGDQLENVGADYQKSMVDGIIGFGLDYNLSNGRIFSIDLRNNIGLNDLNLFKTPAIGGSIYQNTYSVNFSYGF